MRFHSKMGIGYVREFQTYTGHFKICTVNRVLVQSTLHLHSSEALSKVAFFLYLLLSSLIFSKRSSDMYSSYSVNSGDVLVKMFLHKTHTGGNHLQTTPRVIYRFSSGLSCGLNNQWVFPLNSIQLTQSCRGPSLQQALCFSSSLAHVLSPSSVSLFVFSQLFFRSFLLMVVKFSELLSEFLPSCFLLPLHLLILKDLLLHF